MFIKYVGAKPTSHQLALWNWDLCRAVGADNFFIDAKEKKPRFALRLSQSYNAEGDDHPSKDGREYHQDGDTIIAAEGEWFIEVSLWTRYYGPEYERGNWQVICATAEWLEQNIGGEVWYGGDSSGVCATLFDEKARAEMRKHALSIHGRDYYNGFERGPFKTPAPCSLCVKERGMTRHGWGKDYIAVSCGGCGKSFETRDDGKTWTEKKEGT